MKKFLLSFAAIAVLGMSTNLFAGNGEPDEPQTTNYQLKELKAAYGENIQLEEGVQLNQNTQVIMIKQQNPCLNSGFEVCGKASAEARNYARNLANECCCNVIFGYECCDPQTGALLAVLFLAEPTHCN
ncbi:MAG: hypothetical protein EP338_04915 [Bacteroidetes bacterium]|nr:MAG: hypothetical protein EP338_04915 [Bacteroidota bacterium]